MLIVSPETEALVLSKASQAGKTPDQFLRDLVSAKGPGGNPRKIDIARLRAIAEKVSALPLLDTRTEKEITDEGWAL
jgi:hypothetical protein